MEHCSLREVERINDDEIYIYAVKIEGLKKAPAAEARLNPTILYVLCDIILKAKAVNVVKAN